MEYIGAFVPHALGAVTLPALGWMGWKTRRATIIFLALDIVLQACLATWDLICRLKSPSGLDGYKMEDTPLGVTSVLPTMSLLVAITSLLLADLRPCLPSFCRSMIATQLYAILGMPLIPATGILGALGSYLGIQYLREPSGRTILMSFDSVYDDWLHIVLSDAAAITASAYLLFAVLLALGVVLHPQSKERWLLDLGPIHSLSLVALGTFLAALEIIFGVVPDSFPLIIARSILRLMSRALLGIGFGWAYLRAPRASSGLLSDTREKRGRGDTDPRRLSIDGISDTNLRMGTQVPRASRGIRRESITGFGRTVSAERVLLRTKPRGPALSFAPSVFDQTALARLTDHVRHPDDTSPIARDQDSGMATAALSGAAARTKVVNGREYSYKRAKKNIGSIYHPHRISVQECELARWPPLPKGPHPHEILHAHLRRLQGAPPPLPLAVLRPLASALDPQPVGYLGMIGVATRPGPARTSSNLIPRSPTPPFPANRLSDTQCATPPRVAGVLHSPLPGTPDDSPGEVRMGEVQRFRTGDATIFSPRSGQVPHRLELRESRDAEGAQTSGPDDFARRRETDPSMALDPHPPPSSLHSSRGTPSPEGLELPDTPPEDAIVPSRPLGLPIQPRPLLAAPPRPQRSSKRFPTTPTRTSAVSQGSTDIPLFYTPPRPATGPMSGVSSFRHSLDSPPPLRESTARDSSSPRSTLLRFHGGPARYPSTLPSSPHAAGSPSPPPGLDSECTDTGRRDAGRSTARHPSDIQAVLNSLRRLQRDTGLHLEQARLESVASSIYSNGAFDLEQYAAEKEEPVWERVRERRDSLTTISEDSTPLASAGRWLAGK